jgi:hypothetical protein
MVQAPEYYRPGRHQLLGLSDPSWWKYPAQAKLPRAALRLALAWQKPELWLIRGEPTYFTSMQTKGDFNGKLGPTCRGMLGVANYNSLYVLQGAVDTGGRKETAFLEGSCIVGWRFFEKE